MTHCSACHRPLRLPSPDGLGPVCRRNRAAPASAADLFGFRPEVFAQELADKALAEIGSGFAAARRRLGVWA
jgi:hypothetical protein